MVKIIRSALNRFKLWKDHSGYGVENGLEESKARSKKLFRK